MYYLSSNYKLCDQSVILCGNDEDYYLAIKKEKDYSMDETYLCYYSKSRFKKDAYTFFQTVDSVETKDEAPLDEMVSQGSR
ncbi:MAG: hypothetical protein ACLTJ5_07700 [Clostridium sp.]